MTFEIPSSFTCFTNNINSSPLFDFAQCINCRNLLSSLPISTAFLHNVFEPAPTGCTFAIIFSAYIFTVIMKHFISLLVLVFYFHALLPAQVTLVKNSKPSGRIVLTSNDSVDAGGARLLQDFVERITKVKLLIQKTNQIKENDIVIGNDGFNKNVQRNNLPEDGFRVVHNNHVLKVIKGGGKGSI